MGHVLISIPTVLEGVSCYRGSSMTWLDEFVTIKGAARFLGVSANTLRNWHQDTRIPVFRSPASDYRSFKKADLEELLRQIEQSETYLTGRKCSVPAIAKHAECHCRRGIGKATMEPATP